MGSTAFVQLGSISLYPAPDATGVYGNAAFGQKLGNVLVRERISQVPADAQNNHLARKLATFERIGRSDWHGLLPYQTPDFAMEPTLHHRRLRHIIVLVYLCVI